MKKLSTKHFANFSSKEILSGKSQTKIYGGQSEEKGKESYTVKSDGIIYDLLK